MDQGYRFLGTCSDPRVIPRVNFSLMVARVVVFLVCLVTLTIRQCLYLLGPWSSKGGTGSIWINPNKQHYQFLQAITKITASFFFNATVVYTTIAPSDWHTWPSRRILACTLAHQPPSTISYPRINSRGKTFLPALLPGLHAYYFLIPWAGVLTGQHNSIQPASNLSVTVRVQMDLTCL